jgi:hypothetical protein
MLRVMRPRVMIRYFQPWFWTSTSQGTRVEGGQECCGMTRRATTADSAAPTEKKKERAVTRYCFSFGMCSSKRVPSVGIEPPTELPKKKSEMQRVENEFEKDDRIPKTAVKKRVALKAVLRPMRSEHVPQPIAPSIIPANIEDETAPI